MRFYILTILIFISFWLTAQQPSPSGGGSYDIPTLNQCLAEPDRQAIKAQLAKNIADLKKKGILPKTSQQKGMPAYELPLKKGPNFLWNNYDGVTNFVDHNPTATGGNTSSLRDYNCGTRTYDNSNGYNHKGIDYVLWPFPWYMYDNNFVEVIAAEAGTIIGRYDGNSDKNCSCSGSWNAVYLQHADGTITWYGHLKQNSLTSKTQGQSVSKGEYLGIVASSGCSTWPHLHLEVYDSNNNLVDPYSGACNSMNSTSLWVNQPNYREPQLNTLLTHDAEPVHSCTKSVEAPNLQNEFNSGDLVYFAGYYRDQTINDVSNFRIRQPNGSVWQNWSHSSPNTYDNSWWFWTRTLPNNAASGQWIFEIDYNGITHQHKFYVNTTRVNFNVKLNLEGAFDLTSQTMDNRIQALALLPEGIHPYNTPPWNHSGLEGIAWTTSNYPSNSVDWVLLSLRTSPNASSEIAKRAGVLLTNGTLSGIEPLQVKNGINSLYVVVEHRNHLPAMSAQPVAISNNTISYDFRQSEGYQGGAGFNQKQLAGGSWALFGCNADQTNLSGYEITGADRILWQAENGLFDLYRIVDFNLDGDINADDKVLWNQNNGISSAVPR